MGFPDLGAALVRLTSRPVSAARLGMTADQMRQWVARPPRTPDEAVDSCLGRVLAWLFTGMCVLLVLGVPTFLVEDHASAFVARIYPWIVRSGLVLCFGTAIVSAIKLGIAFSTDEAQYGTSAVRRALVRPGNIDIVLPALAGVAFFALTSG